MEHDWTREELEKDIIGQMRVDTIPINVKLTAKQRIFDLSEMEELLKRAKLIGQDECGCRKRMGNCIEPMDGCLSIDEEAEQGIEKGTLRKISVEEALDALKRTYEAGLVHMAYTFSGQDKVGIICSCCNCCCHSLSAVVRFNYPNHVLTSKYISTHDSDFCEVCGRCIEKCQFKARKIVNNELIYDSKKCYGCGLCLECPTEAIMLIER